MANFAQVYQRDLISETPKSCGKHCFEARNLVEKHWFEARYLVENLVSKPGILWKTMFRSPVSCGKPCFQARYLVENHVSEPGILWKNIGSKPRILWKKWKNIVAEPAILWKKMFRSPESCGKTCSSRSRRRQHCLSVSPVKRRLNSCTADPPTYN